MTVSGVGRAAGAGRWAVAWPLLALPACFYGDENNWASRDDIKAAAARCGIADFTPEKAPGAAWSAYVPATIPNHAAKEDCIYADLKRQDLLATR